MQIGVNKRNMIPAYAVNNELGVPLCIVSVK